MNKKIYFTILCLLISLFIGFLAVNNWYEHENTVIFN